VLVDAGGERDTAIPRSGAGLALEFRLLPDDAYQLVLGTNTLTGTLLPGDALTTVRAINSAIGSNANEIFYIGSLTVTSLVYTNEVASVTSPLVTAASPAVDGIPGDWWQQYFGTSVGVSAGADSDNDGFSNLQEYLLGTAPTDAGSSFRSSGNLSKPGVVAVTWSAVPGKVYLVETCSSLALGDWVGEGVPMTAAAGQQEMTREITVPAGGGEFFARVRLVTSQ